MAFRGPAAIARHGVLDLDPDPSVRTFQPDLDVATARQAFDTVADRVLRQRLQRQRGDVDLRQRIGQLPVHPQARPEAQRLDFQIVPGQFDLLRQRDPLRPAQRGAEQVGQVQQHAFGLVRTRMHQCRAGVERVEQEMRADPCAQRFQFQLLGAHRQLPRLPVVLVGQQGQQAHHQRQPQHPRHERGTAMLDAAAHVGQAPGRRGDQQGHRQQDDQAGPCDPLHRQPRQPPARQEQRAQRAQRDPLDPQRGQPEAHQPVSGIRRCQCQDQCQRLAGQHDRHQRGRPPQGIERGSGGSVQCAARGGDWPMMPCRHGCVRNLSCR